MITTPVRLRLSRTKGFDLQTHSRAANGLPAVNVARPGMWGNPFVIDIRRCVGRGVDDREERVADAMTASLLFREMLSLHSRNFPPNDEIVRELRGKNLACWCKPGEPCHADVLLELANRPSCEEVFTGGGAG